MKLTISTGRTGRWTVAAHATDSNRANRRKSINVAAPTGNSVTESRIEQRQRNAKMQAKRLIRTAWQREQQTAQDIQDKQDRIQEKTEQNLVRSNQLSDIVQQRDTLRETHGIDAASQEQKDLELLEKYQNYRNGDFSEEFSEEEITRLKELQNIPMTRYQRQSLELNGVANEIRLEMKQNAASVQQLTEDIRADKKAQLGSQTMLHAQEAADEILAAADGEIVGMLLQEGKDHIDETMEEEKKRTEEAAKKKEEQEEKLERAKKKREETEAILDGELDTEELNLTQKVQNDSDRQAKELHRQLKKIMKENHLVEDDLKGIEIDFDF